MRKELLFFGLMLILLLFIGCTTDITNIIKPKGIVGTWEYGANMGNVIFVFNDDNTGTMEPNVIGAANTYVFKYNLIDENKIEINWLSELPSGYDKTEVINYELVGKNVLIFDGRTFKRVE